MKLNVKISFEANFSLKISTNQLIQLKLIQDMIQQCHTLHIYHTAFVH